MKTILLTAVGSASASPVIRRFRRLGYRVVGCDIYPQCWNASSLEADEFFQAVPTVPEEAYLTQLREAVKRYQVEYLIPLIDLEVDILSPLKAELAAMGCTLCTPDAPAARLCRDKAAMSRLLMQAKLGHTIPTFDPYTTEPAEFPLMLKPRNGRSSQGQVVARDIQAFRAALQARTDYIAQPFLEGDIWTVDVARDCEGNVHAAVRQELLRTVNGLGTTVRVEPNHPLTALTAAIAEKAGIVGVVNMEFIHHEGEYYFLEVNPRYSGGAGFSMLAGMDLPALTIACYSGGSIGQQPPLKPLTMVRRTELDVTESGSEKPDGTPST